MIFYYNLLASCLGYNKLDIVNEYEKIIGLLWMIYSLAFIAYIIGNISSYVSQMNLKELDFNNKMKIIDNLSYDNNLSDDLLKLLTESISNNKNRNDNVSIDELKPFISKDLYSQLQKQLFNSYIKKFRFLEKVNMEIVSILKKFSIFKSEENV